MRRASEWGRQQRMPGGFPAEQRRLLTLAHNAPVGSWAASSEQTPEPAAFQSKGMGTSKEQRPAPELRSVRSPHYAHV